MPIVTLTTDLGNSDYYLPKIKGSLLSIDPATTIIDINNSIDSYNIVQAAFLLKNAFSSFPQGTLHIVIVNTFYDPSPSFILFEKEGHTFLGPNNGIFSLVFEDITTVYEVPLPINNDFPIQTLLVDTVKSIFNPAEELSSVGSLISTFEQKINLSPVTTKSSIRGSVIHIDKFENVIINVSKEAFLQIGENRSFEIRFKRHDPIFTISKWYNDVPIGDILCLFNSSNYLEISINYGRAASLLGLKLDDIIQIEFVKS